MFKNSLRNQTVQFIIDSTEYDYLIDDLTIDLRKIRKRKVLWDESVEYFLKGYHLDITLQWDWFKRSGSTSIEDDIVFLYRSLLAGSVLFVPNPDDTSKLEIEVRDSNDSFPIVNIQNKIRQGDFSLELETVEMITDNTFINPLGFEIV